MKDHTLDIKIGKGAITINGKVVRQIGRMKVSIRVRDIKGPCTDDSCQIIKKLIIEVGDEVMVDGLEPVTDQELSIYLDPEVFRSIDKGRQKGIVLEASRQGFHLKGFSFVS
jgi:hypothetical protein